jgi:hypothetical protein
MRLYKLQMQTEAADVCPSPHVRSLSVGCPSLQGTHGHSEADYWCCIVGRAPAAWTSWRTDHPTRLEDHSWLPGEKSGLGGATWRLRSQEDLSQMFLSREGLRVPCWASLYLPIEGAHDHSTLTCCLRTSFFAACQSVTMAAVAQKSVLSSKVQGLSLGK